MVSRNRIPIPWKHRLRRFRISVLPALSFLLCVVATFWFWGQQVQVTSVLGEVEKLLVAVPTSVAGTVKERPHQPYQLVKANEPVAVLDDTEAKARLKTLRASTAELQLGLNAAEARLRVGHNNLVHEHQRERPRLQLEIDRTNLDIIDRMAMIAGDRAQLLLLEVKLKFLKDGRERYAGAITEQLWQETLQERAVVDTRIKENRKALLVAKRNRQKAQGRLKAWDDTAPAFPDVHLNQIKAPIMQSILVQENAIREVEIQIDSLVILAPIDGIIEEVHTWPGQNVMAGTPIVTIAAHEVRYIKWYNRDASRLDPWINMPVTVSRRTTPSTLLRSVVEEIGPQYQEVPLHHRRDPRTAEWGLPVLISIPAKLGARPGELLDIYFTAQKESKAVDAPSIDKEL